MLGYVVIAGRRFPVTGVRLAGGGIIVDFAIAGPTKPFSGPITIFGEDGVGCWQGSNWELSNGVPDGAVWTCGYTLHIEYVHGTGVKA